MLKPDGIFVMYNYYRQGWIVQRVAAMAKRAFGCDPVVLPLPYAETIRSSEQTGGFTTIIAGCNPLILTAFQQRGKFWLNTLPPENLSADGFQTPPGPTSGRRGNWELIAPAGLVYDNEASKQPTTDDWPFLYVSGKLIPDLTIRSMILIGILGIGMVCLFKPEGRWRLNNRMFFLGAAFMLLETKAVCRWHCCLAAPGWSIRPFSSAR